MFIVVNWFLCSVCFNQHTKQNCYPTSLNKVVFLYTLFHLCLKGPLSCKPGALIPITFYNKEPDLEIYLMFLSKYSGLDSYMWHKLTLIWKLLLTKIKERSKGGHRKSKTQKDYTPQGDKNVERRALKQTSTANYCTLWAGGKLRLLKQRCLPNLHRSGKADACIPAVN